MLAEHHFETFSAPAGADLQASRVVKLAASSGVAVANLPSATTDQPVGVTLYAVADGEAATIVTRGRKNLVAGEALATILTEVAGNSSGQVVAADTGDWVIGTTLEAASGSGVSIAVLIRDPYLKA